MYVGGTSLNNVSYVLRNFLDTPALLIWFVGVQFIIFMHTE